MNGLNDLREQWEKKSEIILEVPRTHPEPELYVITKSELDDSHLSGDFRLLHYFMISDEWQISVDVDFTEDIMECLKFIQAGMTVLVCELLGEL